MIYGPVGPYNHLLDLFCNHKSNHGELIMSHTISVDKSTNIISVKYLGDVSIKERLEAVESVCNLDEVDEKKKLLIDITEIKNNMTKDEQEYFGKYLAARKELKNAKVAVISNNEIHNPNMIINSEAYLNGYSLVPFTSKEDACTWLNGWVK